MYKIRKTYTHAQGFSVCFRQWRATHSHCQFLHGYALQIELEFKAVTLDAQKWVVDFGGLDDIKMWLKQQFDHKLIIAEDDPAREKLLFMGFHGLANVVEMPNVGCESFARYIFEYVQSWLATKEGYFTELTSVTVKEHEGNSATYTEDIA